MHSCTQYGIGKDYTGNFLLFLSCSAFLQHFLIYLLITVQVITFVEVFMRVTQANKVLIIVPVNTIQNWYTEFEKWMPR